MGRYSNAAHLLKRLERTSRLKRSPSVPRPHEPSPRVHSVQRRLTNATLDQLVADYVAGSPTTELMTRYYLGKGTVLGVLRRAGVQMRNQGAANIDLGQAVALYEAGQSLKQLGERFDCDAETVRKEIREAGVRMRKPWERA